MERLCFILIVGGIPAGSCASVASVSAWDDDYRV